MKHVAIIIVTVLLLAGCASHTVTSKMIKDVEEVAKGSNLIVLKNYDVKIKVNDDLLYVDQSKLISIGNKEEKESYLYVYISEGRAERLVTVEIQKLLCDNCTYSYYGQPGSILKGNIRLIKEVEPYQISPLSDLDASRYIMDSAVRLGFILPQNVIVKKYSYILDKNNKNRLLITYYEDASDFGLEPRMLPDTILTQNQIIKIQGYYKRCLEATKVSS